ncbi:hypothetical protein AB0C59_29600 [Streptomyces sp. NPDC048664]|uniref:hypothetical protein n=1 Tax=Streptomyces sp. NPDC048664 TaxID=3154505 RepID=UPI00341F72D6
MSAPHPRTARAGHGLRILRAAVFAAVCVVLAAAGHEVASCAAIPLWTLGAGFLCVCAVTVPLAGRERSLPGIAACLAVGQTVLHTLFGLGQGGTMSMAGGMRMTPDPTSGSDAALVARAAHVLCGAGAATLSPAQAQRILSDARLGTGPGAGAGTVALHHPADALSAASGAWWSMLPSVPMLLGHVLAAVAAGWVLRHGDMALLRIMRLSAHGIAEGAFVRSLRSAFALIRALLAGLPGAPGTGPRPPHPAFLGPPGPHTAPLRHSVTRRGPPFSTLRILAA